MKALSDKVTTKLLVTTPFTQQFPRMVKPTAQERARNKHVLKFRDQFGLGYSRFHETTIVRLF